MTGALLLAAALTVLLGVLAGAVVLVTARRPALALGLLTDFLLAAGLLRLAVARDWSAVAAAAGIVLVRHLVMAGVRAGTESGRSPTV